MGRKRQGGGEWKQSWKTVRVENDYKENSNSQGKVNLDVPTFHLSSSLPSLSHFPVYLHLIPFSPSLSFHSLAPLPLSHHDLVPFSVYVLE